jgi:hypothetical protein
MHKNKPKKKGTCIMSNTPEYERGYKDGAKDCQALYGRILDRICMALDEKGEKEQAKKARKIFAGEEKRACLFRDRREAAPSLLNRNAAKIGEVVFTKSDVTVLDIGIIKRINPLEIYARSTSLDRFGIPCQYGGVEYCRWYGTGIVVSLDMWRNITKDASAEEVCKRMNIPYWQR